MFSFGVQEFRCFHRPRPVRLAKLTLLVGENSTGKTSFLAAINAATATLKMEDPDFYQDPFNLGAYDQIAHHRGRWRAKEFYFEMVRDTSHEIQEKFIKTYHRNRRLFGRVRVRLVFTKKSAQPSITKVTIACGPVSVVLLLDDKDRLLNIRTPKHIYAVPRENASQYVSFGKGKIGLQTLYYFFDRLVLGDELLKKRSDRDQEMIDEVRLLHGLVHHALWLFGHYAVDVAAPIRTKPRRTYDPRSERPDPEGEHIPYMLARLKAEKTADWSSLKDSLAKFGAAAGLFDEIDIKRKGTSDSDPFQVLVRRLGQSSNIIDVGYGVSQILPVLAEIILSEKDAIHLIQQPEVHLHPRAQAEFATFLKDSFSTSNSYCILETHSDFIVDRIRSHIANDELSRDDVSLIFFERKEKQVELYQIELDEDGNIAEAPRGYRDFFQKEVFRTLGLGNVSAD